MGFRSRGFRAVCSVLAIGAGLVYPSVAQPSSEGGSETFFDAVTIDVVNVEVFVTDKKGRPVTGLGPESFELFVDGKPVAVTNFYAQAGRNEDPSVETASTDSPPADAQETPASQQMHLLIFIDNQNLKPTSRKRSFKYLRRYLEEELAPEIPVAVVTWDQTLEFRNEFSVDRELLKQALDAAEAGGLAVVDATATLQRIATDIAERRGDTDLPVQLKAAAEAEFRRSKASIRVFRAVIDSLAGIPGRKAILHVSDGISTKPVQGLFAAAFGPTDDAAYFNYFGQMDLMPDFQELARRANAAQVTLYAIDADPTGSYLERSSGQGSGSIDQPVSTFHSRLAAENNRAPLELAATDTGGRRVEASGRLAQRLSAINSDFDSFYSLGFEAPADSTRIKHRIEVKVSGKGYIVRHRQAYEDRAADQKAADAVIASVLFGESEDSLDVVLEAQAVRVVEDESPVLPVKVKIPISQVAFLPRGDEHQAQLTFFVTVKGAEGGIRPVQKVPFRLRIPAEKMEEAQGRTADYELPVPLGPGDQYVAIGVRDDIAGIRSTLRLEL